MLEIAQQQLKSEVDQGTDSDDPIQRCRSPSAFLRLCRSTLVRRCRNQSL